MNPLKNPIQEQSSINSIGILIILVLLVFLIQALMTLATDIIDFVNYVVPKVSEEDKYFQRSEISAYSPRIQETDNTPTINAMGLRVKEGDIANNCLPFNSLVEIEGKIYVVRDRMNLRYGCNHFDIFTWNTQEALNFGRQIMAVKIIN